MSHHFSSQFYPIFTKQLFLTYSGLCFHFASPKNTRKILISWRFQGMWNESTRQKRVKLKLMTFQRQPLRGVLRKRCSENMQQNYRRTPTPKCDFNKFVLQLYWNCRAAWVISWLSSTFDRKWVNNFCTMFKFVSSRFWKMRLHLESNKNGLHLAYHFDA